MKKIKVGDLVKFHPAFLGAKDKSIPGSLVLLGGIDGISHGTGIFANNQTALVTKLFQTPSGIWWAYLYTDKRATGWACVKDLLSF
jgi:hypothetical protein